MPLSLIPAWPSAMVPQSDGRSTAGAVCPLSVDGTAATPMVHPKTSAIRLRSLIMSRLEDGDREQITGFRRSIAREILLHVSADLIEQLKSSLASTYTIERELGGGGM